LHASRAAIEYGRWLAVPLPTERDRENREPKIQANLVLAGGSESEIANLLRNTGKNAAPRVIILKSKDDYEQCVPTTPSKASTPTVAPFQGSLILNG
jgi:DNA processing protein